MEKTCSKCGVVKGVGEFNKHSKNRDGFQTSCRPCATEYKKANKEKIKAQKAGYYRANYERLTTRIAEYRAANLEKVKRTSRRWKKANSAKINERRKSRRKTDSLFRLMRDIRCLTHNALRRRGYRKASRTIKLIGTDFVSLYWHLVQTALRNYGVFWFDESYHIDHVIPLASAKTEAEVVALSHYTNLQYLTPADNLSKSCKLDWSFGA